MQDSAPPSGNATPAGVQATTAQPAPMPALTGGGDLVTAGSTLQLLASLLLVLGLIVALGWLSRRMHRLTPSRARALRVVDALPVGTRERIVLVEVGGQQLLVGLAPGRVQTLHVLETPVSAVPADAHGASAPDGAGPARPHATGFAAVLAKLAR